MTITSQELVGKAMELLKAGLGPFIERKFKSKYQNRAQIEASGFMGEDPRLVTEPVAEWDVWALLKLMWAAWNDVFRESSLGRAERSLVSELQDVRNKWAHQRRFNDDDADRALDSVARLLKAVSARQADEVDKMKKKLRRRILEEQIRNENGKRGGDDGRTSSDDSTIPGKDQPNIVSQDDEDQLVKDYVEQNQAKHSNRLVASHFKEKYPEPSALAFSKDPGGDLRVSDRTTGKSVALYVRFSQDKLEKHRKVCCKIGNKLMALGLWGGSPDSEAPKLPGGPLGVRHPVTL